MITGSNEEEQMRTLDSHQLYQQTYQHYNLGGFGQGSI